VSRIEELLERKCSSSGLEILTLTTWHPLSAKIGKKKPLEAMENAHNSKLEAQTHIL
jgi:hypothetical protein